MAPKKKQQQQQPKQKKQTQKSSSSSSSAPKLQISAENEQRLRRLLLNNSSRPAPSPSTQPSETISKSQKAKRLRTIYEKLSCEGFDSNQIEQALSALNDGATFEATLDWLCLNLPGNELPLKFSSGTSLSTEGGSISIISTAREDWVPLPNPSSKDDRETREVPLRIKERIDDDTLDLQQSSQADWIKQYVEQQEEEEWETLGSDVGGSALDEVSDPRFRADSIAKEYHIARLEAMSAKLKGDKKHQEIAGNKIRKLKQEMSDLGLSEEILALDLGDEFASCCMAKDAVSDSNVCKESETISFCDSGSRLNSHSDEVEPPDSNHSSAPFQESAKIEDEDPDVELNNLFFEDASASEPLPPEVLKHQKKEKMAQLSGGSILEKIDGIWKKGDPRKIPKAVLQQLCQKLGWEAPKFTKLPAAEGFSYSVSILRTASGRGKNRKPGGLVTLQLPDISETIESAEDAQNRVAAFALYRLFTEYPVNQLITEPYSSYVMNWMEGESTVRIEDGEETRRASFVDSLLSAGDSEPSTYIAPSVDEMPIKALDRENVESASTAAKLKRINRSKALESINLRQEQENKIAKQKYKEMLDARATLPIAELRVDILQLLKENDVLVVCGETGCGKTTQVPQFILDDMIKAGMGGYCNIVCTQPRRIAAISVAERVADERCEPPPGSDGSLVGFQVRLDSARNERTKLLFCTTGILLRKLAGDNNLADVTHVIVDEVHERSLLGDFLLVILKNLIEKQSASSTRKLKVILMSATVDSSLFSRYFGNCPVLTAQGRTHPVSTHFLEDIYENIEYCLASDSPASLRQNAPTKEKLRSSTVDNHRGKKNLVLSSWGDDSQLYDNYVNPNYDSSSYISYSERTQENLKSLNEDVIDYDLLEDLVSHIDESFPPGAVLIFLPGVAEIYMLLDRLVASYQFGNSSDWLLPLHSSLASFDQKKVFLTPPGNIRKVIIATDIAETSITIDDVVYVIDGGKHKEHRYNPQKKLSSMVEDWISRANARQRRGRAGRVKPGICFCLYTRHRFENLMRPYQAPEMLRMPLMELCLQVKSLSLGYIKPFLLKAIEPPREEAMTSALSMLYEVGAIEGDEELTPLGYHLAKLPVDVLIGKMMIYGGIFCCLSPILSISAFLSYKSPFTYPKEERQHVEIAKQSLLTDKSDGLCCPNVGDMQSDHIIMAVAYNKWAKILLEKGAKAAQNFCNSHFLSSSVMYMIRDMRIQFGSLLADIGVINLPSKFQSGKMKDKLDHWFSDMTQPFNKYSNHSSIVKSILCAGLYPNVAASEDGIVDGAFDRNLKPSSRPTGKGHPVWYDRRREVYIHPSSTNCHVKAFQYPFLVYLEKVETNKVFLRDTSIISPYSILLFGGSINILHQTGLVTIDGWLKLTAPAQTAVLFKELRLTLHNVLKELIRKPEKATLENEVIRSIVHLLLEEDKAQN